MQLPTHLTVGGEFYNAMFTDWFRYTMLGIYVFFGAIGAVLSWGFIYLMEYLTKEYDL